MPDSKIQGTPTAESTRIPLKTSIEKREAEEQTKPLTPNQLLEMKQTIIYKKSWRRQRKTWYKHTLKNLDWKMKMLK